MFPNFDTILLTLDVVPSPSCANAPCLVADLNGARERGVMLSLFVPTRIFPVDIVRDSPRL